MTTYSWLNDNQIEAMTFMFRETTSDTGRPIESLIRLALDSMYRRRSSGQDYSYTEWLGMLLDDNTYQRIGAFYTITPAINVIIEKLIAIERLKNINDCEVGL